jgi:hypothetical protein
MVERRKQGISYYCDEKYSPRHKCREENFFQIDASTSSPSEDIPSDEALDQDEAPPSDHVEAPVVTLVEPEEPIILLHSLSGISAPQTLSSRAISNIVHNFIHRGSVD